MAAGVLAGAVASGGLAYAAIPAGGDIITACYHNNSGAVRVVDSAAQCRNQETALTWNQEGAQGPIGPQGPDGPAGPIEPAGQDGRDGADGQPGPQGLPGEPGQDGADGQDGVDGQPGPQGIPGISAAKFARNTAQISVYTRVVEMALTQGSWVVQASATVSTTGDVEDDSVASSADCELRVNGTAFIGGGGEFDLGPSGGDQFAIPVNGGVFVQDASDMVGLYCRSLFGPATANAQMVAMQVGGFL